MTVTMDQRSVLPEWPVRSAPARAGLGHCVSHRGAVDGTSRAVPAVAVSVSDSPDGPPSDVHRDPVATPSPEGPELRHVW